MKRWMPWMRVVVLAAAAGGVWWRVNGDSCEYHRMSPQAVQLVVVVSALDVWRSDNGRYPQHLDALLTAGPAGLGPYRTAPDLLDVWGYPLVYRPDPDGSGFRLSTVGADGKPGGRGVARDIVVVRPDVE